MRVINLTDPVFEGSHFTWQEMLHSEAGSRHGYSNMPTDDSIFDNIIKTTKVLEIERAYFGKPILVTSCYRSGIVNIMVGGALNSAHLKGLACDHHISGMSIRELCAEIPKCFKDYDQIIYEFGETGWCHIGLSLLTPRHEIISAQRINGKTVYSTGLVT